MTTLRRLCWLVARTTAIAACVVLLLPAVALAQSPAPDDGGADVFGNMPGAVVLLVPIVIGGALYISRRLGPQDDGTSDRREGAVSRTLARSKRT